MPSGKLKGLRRLYDAFQAPAAAPLARLPGEAPAVETGPVGRSKATTREHLRLLAVLGRFLGESLPLLLKLLHLLFSLPLEDMLRYVTHSVALSHSFHEAP